jgi:superkiller protein 3
MLGTSLVHHYPPKHHASALRILDGVLSDDEANVPSLMGRAYIFQASGDWAAAATSFSRVCELLPDDVDKGIRAREEQAWCALHQGNGEVAMDELKAISEVLDNLEDREVDQARCWWKMGKCAWQTEGSYPLPSSLFKPTRFCRI